MAPGKTVGIITARGGSKRLPNKNLAPLAGRPLIAWTIGAAKACGRLDAVVVTTDSPEIAAVSRGLGAAVIDRPAALATDTATSEAAVRHAVETLIAAGDRPETIVLLQPTSPLRTAAHLTSCLDAFRAARAGAAVAVVADPHSAYKTLTIADDRLVPLFGWEVFATPRQALAPTFRPNGAIYVVGCADFLRTGRLYIDPVMPFEMAPAESLDIDTAEDLAAAARVLEAAAVT